MIALLVAAALVPASAEAVLAVDDVSGLRALLETAAKHAPSLAPAQLGLSLRNSVGVDLFAEDAQWGLARRGGRQLVFSRRTIGLSAPAADVKAAKAALAAWLQGNPQRAGKVVRGRVLTASGRGAAALVAAMAKPSPLPRELAARATGPAWLWVRFAEPFRAAVFALDASGIGLIARGLVTASSPVLSGRAPSCAGGIACLAAGLAPAGRGALATLFDQLGLAPQPGLRTAARAAERLDAIDARQLADEKSLPRALHISPAYDGAPSSPADGEGYLDLAQLDAAIGRLTPLDALRGSLAAGAYAVHVVYGELLRNTGPLTLTAWAASPNAAEVELRLPLR